MQAKAFSLAAGAVLFSAGVISAATVTDNLNLRSGPGIDYSIIGAMPAAPIYAYCAAALRGAVWPSMTLLDMQADSLFPLVDRSMRLHQGPELSRQATVTPTATVTVTSRLLIGAMAAGGITVTIGGIADANCSSRSERHACSGSNRIDYQGRK